jgi:5-formyltetrahydrofolate cyclo-ligase
MREEKAELRRQILARLKNLSPAQRIEASHKACQLLEQQRVWREAQSVLFYAPLPGELDVWPLLEKALAVGKLAALPRFDLENNRYLAAVLKNPAAEVKPGHLGVREPLADCQDIPLNGLDLALVPGVGFDLHGRRLGRGKGFYDQILAAVRGTTCGVAFEEQLVRRVPVEPHDVSLNCLLTPARWVEL